MLDLNPLESASSSSNARLPLLPAASSGAVVRGSAGRRSARVALGSDRYGGRRDLGKRALVSQWRENKIQRRAVETPGNIPSQLLKSATIQESIYLLQRLREGTSKDWNAPNYCTGFLKLPATGRCDDFNNIVFHTICARRDEPSRGPQRFLPGFQRKPSSSATERSRRYDSSAQASAASFG